MRRIAILFSLSVACAASAADDWVRDWERAQRVRPATITSVARIAPASEPGAPLIVRGRVMRGNSPLSGVVVFAYQTDRTGVYHVRGGSGWRLRGWARTDKEGRFEFRTIRPGSYPGTRNPSHIHLSVEGASVARQTVDEIQFADDPFADKRDRGVWPVAVRNGVQHVEVTISVNDRSRF